MNAARWTNGILAIWLAFSAFLGFEAGGNIVNLATVGLFVAGVGLALIPDSKWQGWTATLAGFWLFAAVFVPFLRSGAGLVWNSLIVSAAILVASVSVQAPRQPSSRLTSSPASPGEATSSERPREVTRSGERHLVHH